MSNINTDAGGNAVLGTGRAIKNGTGSLQVATGYGGGGLGGDSGATEGGAAGGIVIITEIAG